MTAFDTRTRAFGVDEARATNAFQIDARDTDFTWDEVSVVQIDNPPHEQAFETDQFYKIPFTAARPVEQTYQTPDGSVTMKKPSTELRQASWSLDNSPITLGHPSTRIVDSVDLVHGFVRHPQWDGADERLKGEAYIPVNDTEAQAWVEDNDGVSIGFWYETDPSADDVDAFQRDLLIDHVAIVEEGRCSREDGCGLGIDSSDAVRGFTAVAADAGCSDGTCSCGLHLNTCGVDEGDFEQHKYESEAEAREAAERIGCEGAHQHDDGRWMPCESHGDFEDLADEMATDAAQGDWVQWEDGSAHGKVIDRKTDGCFSDRIDGDHEICADEDDPVLLIEHYDSETGESTDTNVAHKASTVNSWSGPGNDSAYGHDDASDVDLSIPEAVQNAAQQALDARSDDDVTVNGMTDRGWRRAETLADGGSLSPDDIVGGQDGMANWWSRHADDMIDTSGDSLSLHGADDDNPWSNNSYTAAKGWGGVAGYRFAIQKGNEIKRARDEDPDYSRLGNDRPTEDRHWTDHSKISFDHQIDSRGVDINMAAAPAPYYIGLHDEGSEHSRQNVDVGEQLGRRGPYDAHEDIDDVRVEFDQRIHEPRRVYALLYYATPDGDMGDPIESQQGFIFDSAVVVPDAANRTRSLTRSLQDTAVDAVQFTTDLFDGDGSYETEIALDSSRTVAGVTFSGVRSGQLDEAEIPTDDFESHYLYPGDTKSESSYPVVDAENYLRAGNVEAAHSLGARGGVDADEHRSNMESLNEVTCNADTGCAIDPDAFESDSVSSNDSLTVSFTENTIMTDSNGDGGAISVSDLAVDAIADEHDGVAELKEKANEVDELQTQLDAARETVDELKDELADYKADEKSEIVDEITALTDTWDENELMDLEIDTLEDRLSLAEDLAADVSGGVGNDGGVANDGGSSPDTEYEKGEVYDLADTA